MSLNHEKFWGSYGVGRVWKGLKKRYLSKQHLRLQFFSSVNIFDFFAQEPLAVNFFLSLVGWLEVWQYKISFQLTHKHTENIIIKPFLSFPLLLHDM